MDTINRSHNRPPKFVGTNAVRARPGWFYGVRVISYREPPNDVLPVCTFDIFRPESGQRIEGLVASGYRTTKLARYCGEKDLRGYEHVAHETIDRA